MYYVYSYTEPNKDRPFYIGKGKGRRAWGHLRPGNQHKTTHFQNKLAKMLREGITPDVAVIYEDCTSREACDAERYFIRFFGRLDLGTGCLTNHTDGGEGAAGRNLSPEAKAKLIAANTGREVSPETRAKMSAANKGHQPSLETKAKMSAARQGRSKSPEHAAKLAVHLRDNGMSRRKPLQAIDPISGEIVKVYESRESAVRDGHKKGSISNVLRGKSKTHRGSGSV